MLNRRSLNVLLPTIGSAGDVHPVVALGTALKRRGHRPTILTNSFFQDLIEGQGIGFLPVGTVEEAQATIADPDLWHPLKGFGVIARRAIIPAVAPVYGYIERHADADTVVAASSISFGARIAQDRLGVPTATIHLQPSIIRSLIDQGKAGPLRISASQPMWFKRGFFGLSDWLLLDRALKRPINDFRRTLKLPPVDHVMHRWMHSPQLVIGFFPEWFAAPQADWPAHTHLAGFPLWDSGHDAPAVPDAEAFLAAGPPPVIITPGSAGATMQRYFRESITAVRTLGMRAMLVTNFPDQVPADLPPNVRTFGYLPFSRILPRAAVLVYHGGIGTLAQTIKAGIPQLVVPNSHDQFDNAWRIERLGLGKAVPQSRYSAGRVVKAIRAVLDDAGGQGRRGEYASRIDADAAVTRACELIEGLAGNASRH